MQIIGHRGARAIAPENTLAGIQRALDMGVDWIEFDVRRTNDNKLVVIHDRHTGRIANKRLLVHQSRYDQLRSLKTHSGEPIPQLSEVLALIGRRAKINCELKSPGCADGVVHAIRAMVHEGYRYDHFLVSSFYPHILAAVQAKDPKIPLALLELHLPLHLLFARQLTLKAVGMHHATVSNLAVRLVKKSGLFVYAYTVNAPDEARRLATMGVDAVVTDYPDRIRSIVS